MFLKCFLTHHLSIYYLLIYYLLICLFFLIQGSLAGAIAAALTNPLDIIKTRLQTQNLEPCPTPSSIITKTKNSPRGGLSSGGSGGAAMLLHGNGLLSSSITSSSINQPSQVITGERIIRTFNTMNSNVHNTNNNPVISNPISANKVDIKVSYKSAIQVVQHIIREEGLKGFLRGLAPRMLLHAPAVAISWTTYETVKSFLSNEKSIL